VKRPPPLDGLRDSKSPIPPKKNGLTTGQSFRRNAVQARAIKYFAVGFAFTVLIRQQPPAVSHDKAGFLDRPGRREAAGRQCKPANRRIPSDDRPGCRRQARRLKYLISRRDVVCRGIGSRLCRERSGRTKGSAISRQTAQQRKARRIAVNAVKREAEEDWGRQ
jgi:hypothetical protein